MEMGEADVGHVLGRDEEGWRWTGMVLQVRTGECKEMYTCRLEKDLHEAGCDVERARISL